ncbi:MAG: 23S rRNA (adenine(2503)-C(2))-methyltransferase RlmN, partial [Pseudomonadota bacterium]
MSERSGASRSSAPPAAPDLTRRAVTPELLTTPRREAEADSGARRNLLGLSREALAQAAEEAGAAPRQARMRAAQIWRWLYVRGATDFEAMSDLAKGFRAALAERFEIRRPEVTERQISADGTRKYLLRLEGGHEVEAV